MTIGMDEAALFGGVLYEAQDPMAMAPILADLLMSSQVDKDRVRKLGLEPALVESLRHGLTGDRAAIEVACIKGAAWVLGHRSATRHDSWELVASLPPDAHLPLGLRRTTAETLVMVVCEAERCLRFSAPYIDPRGIAIVSEAIAAATTRGVAVEVFRPRSKQGIRAVDELQSAIVTAGDPGRLCIVRMAAEAPWSHLKVVVSDGSTAYIGSANFTGAGLVGRNLELGVLVRGYQVRVIERVLDIYREI